MHNAGDAPSHQKFLKETCTYETDIAAFIVDVRKDDRDS